MRKVISNTTPILSLLKLGKLELLQSLYAKVIIPNAVYNEIEKGRDKPYYIDLTKLDWISIKEIENIGSRNRIGCNWQILKDEKNLSLLSDLLFFNGFKSSWSCPCFKNTWGSYCID